MLAVGDCSACFLVGKLGYYEGMRIEYCLNLGVFENARCVSDMVLSVVGGNIRVCEVAYAVVFSESEDVCSVAESRYLCVDDKAGIFVSSVSVSSFADF